MWISQLVTLIRELVTLWSRHLGKRELVDVHLFVLHVLVFVLLLFLLVSGLDEVCDCGTPWTFLLTILTLYWRELHEFISTVDLLVSSQCRREKDGSNIDIINIVESNNYMDLK